jgi:hypothetical protein
MNIAVVGAGGRSGQAFVSIALAAGHTIRAGVTRNDPFTPAPGLTVMHCDGTNLTDVTSLIDGQDAVVSLVGHTKGSQPHVQTVVIQTIIQAMKHKLVRRLISLTGTGVRFDGDIIPLIDRFMNFAVGVVDPDRINDGKDHVDAIKLSDTDWTIIRVLKLQNVQLKDYLLTKNGPTKIIVGREEVAHAMIDVLENQSFIRQAPMISQKIILK